MTWDGDRWVTDRAPGSTASSRSALRRIGRRRLGGRMLGGLVVIALSVVLVLAAAGGHPGGNPAPASPGQLAIQLPGPSATFPSSPGGLASPGASGSGSASQPSLAAVSTVPPASHGPLAAGGKPAAPVTIDQLGTVLVVSLPADTITRTNGKPSIGLQIVKGPNTNTVTVANEVWSALPAIESSIGHGVHLDAIQDQ